MTPTAVTDTASETSRRILVTGGTGYLGRALIPSLVERGHHVTALVRPGSETRLTGFGASFVLGNALESGSVAAALGYADTLVHLVGVPKPGPAKVQLFREIDLVSIRASVTAAKTASRRPHLVYLSVAQPAPVMKAYIAVRREGEQLIREAGLRGTFLRPWYVLGPGHRWPMLLHPVYAILRRFPSTRAGAERLGFVSLAEMVRATVHCVEVAPDGIRVVDVPMIRALSREMRSV